MKSVEQKPEQSNGEHRFRVSLEQTDMLGLIHNSVVFRLFEIAEIEWFRSLGIHWLEFPGCVFPRINVAAKFIRPVRFDDQCVIKSRIIQLRSAKATLLHEIICCDKLCIIGQVEFACLSKETFTPTIFPEKMREVLSKK